MDVELRQLRCLVAIVETGTFTDAAGELGLSQAQVSRTLAGLENALGVRLLRRTSRQVTPTAAGTRILARARRVLAEAEDLVREATTGDASLRVGHAWSAMGRHTVAFQRRWARSWPQVRLQLVRTNSATAGLGEGACDVAVVRSEPDRRRFSGVVVGLERRYCAMATDDAWARRRFVRLSDIAERTVLIDRRAGSTTPQLWPEDQRPGFDYTADVDDWLTAVSSGRVVGITSEATLTQYRRSGVVFRPVRDAPPIPVRVIWWRDERHAHAGKVVDLLTELYRR
ncbi:LysR family transcriptional regulator [Saccharopolyspora karakumensis]|uniref:LysR family transcriptional regulator n=1 Tax=Saccharopolyspora karakumensis TaxID=2530386 RepID=A0A4R5BDT8_9PSEU|nr:LysR family transcriptional regulator [Saccharopolyspora karakumensis]TDD81954.1 LysR family transcriptional regulator [Saccharopolyspora karakumensis]